MQLLLLIAAVFRGAECRAMERLISAALVSEALSSCILPGAVLQLFCVTLLSEQEAVALILVEILLFHSLQLISGPGQPTTPLIYLDSLLALLALFRCASKAALLFIFCEYAKAIQK